MKIITAQEMGRIERLAYEKGASEEQFMESAGTGVAEAIQHLVAKLHLKPYITLLCGSGNNAGDAYVAGRILQEGGFDVQAIALAPFDKSSPLCQLQSRRFASGGGKISYVKELPSLPFGNTELLIDGILGTGFHGEVKGLLKEVIEKVNASGLPVLSIDIPSGIDGTTGAIGGIAVRAFETLFLGLPKKGCFSQDVWDLVGNVRVHNFGLDQEYIDAAEVSYFLIDDALLRPILPNICRTRHKYEAGYVVGLGGSLGMPGAPVMSSFAALRAGAGIIRLLHPAGMEAELASAPFEVIRQGYPEGDISTILAAMSRASALFIGPGMGTGPAALAILQGILPHLQKPCVIDAEALTLLAEHDIPLPPQTIMTPHHGEMKRLLHAPKNLPFKDLLDQAQAYAQRKNVTLVLKGAPTFVLHPGSLPYVCAHGDPGMATAGSGDVLTGVIAGFLAQIHDPLNSALLGVQFHSLAGEYAAEQWTSYCMTATDITTALPLVFKKYQFTPSF